MKTCHSDNIALDERPLPPPAGKHYTPDRSTYSPARDNPQDNMREGADDHKKYQSTTDHDGTTTYKRHHS